MAFTPIEGSSLSSAVLERGRILDMEPMAKWLDENSYWFEALTRKIGAIVDKKRMLFSYRTRGLWPQTMRVTAVSNAGSGTITVDHPEYTHADVLLYNTTNGELYISQDATPGAGTLTVSNVDGTATIKSATAIGDIIQIYGDSHAEGEAIPAAFSQQEEPFDDYIMQSDKTVQTSDIQQNEEEYDSLKQRFRDQKAAMIEYHRNMNMLFYTGQSTREIVTATGLRRHCLGGIISKITKSRDLTAVPTGLTVQVISDCLGETVYHSASSSAKASVWGSYAWAAISAMPVNYLQVSPNEKIWGIRVSVIRTGHGDLDVGYDPQLNASNGMADRGFILDTKWIRQVRLQNMPVVLKTNIGSPADIHNTTDVITGTFSLQAEYGNDLHYAITGIH